MKQKTDPGKGAPNRCYHAGHRRHAEIENAIRDLKYGVGLNHLPSLEKWLNARPAERDLRSYKHQLLMLLRVSISSKDIPRLNSNAISAYSLKIVDALRDPNRSDEECKKAVDLLRATLAKFGRRGGERNPPHRLRAFTERLIEELPSGEPDRTIQQLQNSGMPGGVERGRIIWFDGWKNYGFIERDGGGDIFVHDSEISAIPWHLRVTGIGVRFKAVENPKSRGMQMASEVELDNT